MHADYNIPILKQLRDQQVRFAPREKKVEQVNRAEKLLAELDPSRTYSYEYLCFRITDFRPETIPSTTMKGSDAWHDLRLFVEDVSDAADIRTQEMPEPVHTVEELSKLFKVSTKTIARWREQGLVAVVSSLRTAASASASCIAASSGSSPVTASACNAARGSAN